MILIQNLPLTKDHLCTEKNDPQSSVEFPLGAATESIAGSLAAENGIGPCDQVTHADGRSPSPRALLPSLMQARKGHQSTSHATGGG